MSNNKYSTHIVVTKTTYVKLNGNEFRATDRARVECPIFLTFVIQGAGLADALVAAGIKKVKKVRDLATDDAQLAVD